MNVAIKQMYPLTPLQEGMLFHHVRDEENSAYIVQNSFDIEGDLNVKLLEQSYQELINRHDVFRTIFIYKNTKKALQVVLEKRELKINLKKISEKSEEQQRELISSYMEEEKEKGFDLSVDIPMKVTIFQTQERKYKVIWSFHHIVIDGWSLGTLFRELLHIYEALSKGTPLHLAPPRPYSDFVHLIEKKDKAKAASYWGQYLEGCDNVTALPDKKKVKENERYQKRDLLFTLGKEQTEKLQQLAAKCQVTFNTVLQTIWGLLLQRYNGTDEAVFGAVVSGRTSEISGIESMIGLFINTIPVRITSSPIQTFTEILREVQNSATLSSPYASYPLYEIQSNTALKQDLIHSIIVFQNLPVNESLKKLGSKMGLQISNFVTLDQTSYDFNLIVFPGEETLVKFSYNQNVYDEDTILRIKGHFQQVVKQVIDNPLITIKEIEIVTEEEKEMLIYGFNQTEADYPKDQTIHQLFEAQVERTPDNIAVADGDQYLTYAQLNERANYLARVLRANGLEKEGIVALLISPSSESIISILAVLKAGGTYLPIDPDYPIERIEYIYNNSRAAFLIASEDHFNKTSFEGYRCNITKELEGMKESGELSNLECISSPRDAAYVIYTSGTTGSPKGVVIEHENVVRLLINDSTEFDFNSHDVWTMFHSYCFDMSVWEMYGALLYGGKLVIVPRNVAKSPAAFASLLQKEQVTVLNQTPTAFYAFLQDDTILQNNKFTLRYITFAGEALNPSKIYKFRECYPDVKLINMYGITEITVHATYREMNDSDFKGEKSNIGYPLPTLTSYIFDENQKLVPIGVTGEIYIGGKGVARGYLNQPELTGQRFIANPFIPNDVIYRSGDLAKWLPDGTMEYLGRKDFQVKIRGYRIECGEIETQLLNHPTVREAVVLARETEEGSKYLCAYIVGEEDTDITAIRKHLEKQLPDYMVPSYFMLIEQIPLTSNGKVDRGNLPLPDVQSWMRRNEYEAPQGELEEQLAEIWAKVLEVNQVGRTDDFFEIGGHSIKAVKLDLELEQNDLLIEDMLVYSCRTIKDMAEYIREHSASYI